MCELVTFKPLAPLDARIPLSLLLRVPKAHSHHLVIVVDYLTLVHLVAGHIKVIEDLLSFWYQHGCDISILGISVRGGTQELRERLY